MITSKTPTKEGTRSLIQAIRSTSLDEDEKKELEKLERDLFRRTTEVLEKTSSTISTLHDGEEVCYLHKLWRYCQ